MATQKQNTQTAVVTKAPLNKVNHGAAWKVYKKSGFDPSAPFALTDGTTNPWQAHAPGHRFYQLIAEKKPATVGAVMELAKANKIGDAKGHLAWLYTWPASRNVAYCTIGGKAFDPSQPLPKVA